VPARTVGRIQTRAAFAQLQRSRSRANVGPVRVSFVPAPAGVPGLYPQVGYAIGKPCGNAVVRNTLRRRMRETVRSIAADLPDGTYLVRLAPMATKVAPAELSTQVCQALQRAGQAA
jgi:ribonuclease P protein component